MFLTDNLNSRWNIYNGPESIHEEFQEVYNENEMQIMNATAAMIRLEHEAIMTDNVELLNEGIGSFWQTVVEKFKEMINAVIDFFMRIVTWVKNWFSGKSDSGSSAGEDFVNSAENKKKYNAAINKIEDNMDSYAEDVIAIFKKGATSGLYKNIYLDGKGASEFESAEFATTIKDTIADAEKAQMDLDWDFSKPNIDQFEKGLNKIDDEMKEVQTKIDESLQKFEVQILGVDQITNSISKQNVSNYFRKMHSQAISEKFVKIATIEKHLKMTKEAIKKFEVALKKHQGFIDKGGVDGESRYDKFKDMQSDLREKESTETDASKRENSAKTRAIMNRTRDIQKKCVQVALKACKHYVSLFKKYEEYDIRCRTHWMRNIISLGDKSVTAEVEESYNFGFDNDYERGLGSRSILDRYSI